MSTPAITPEGAKPTPPQNTTPGMENPQELPAEPVVHKLNFWQQPWVQNYWRHPFMRDFYRFIDVE